MATPVEAHIQPVIRRRYYLRLDTAAESAEREFIPVLEGVLKESGAETAVVYRFKDDLDEFEALASRSRIPARIREVGATLSAEASAWLRQLNETRQGFPASDPDFESLPEVLKYGLRSVAVLPLRAEIGLLGFISLGCTRHEPFQPAALLTAFLLSGVIGAVLERDALRGTLEERKVVERAKGILQRRGFSEERAYLLLRNTSRRLRQPMAQLAREVIAERALIHAGVSRAAQR